MEQERIEYIDVNEFLGYKKSTEEQLTPEEQIEDLHKKYPLFKRQVIKAILGYADDDDIAYLKEEQDKIRQEMEKGGYELVEGKWILSENIDNFIHNKITDYEPATIHGDTTETDTDGHDLERGGR